MNPPIVRLYAFFALLFGILVFATSWWAVFTAPKLRDNASNRRPLLAEERIKRGTIRSADGRVLARSVKIDKERYRRTYPTKDEFAHAIGYSFTTLGRSGLEQFRNDPLTRAPHRADRRDRLAAEQARRGRLAPHDAQHQGAAGGDRRARTGARARWWRWSRAPARCW